MSLTLPWKQRSKEEQPQPLPDNVVDIDAYRPHEVAELICLRCRYRWVSVHRTDMNLKDYPCPCCGRRGTVIHTGQNLKEE